LCVRMNKLDFDPNAAALPDSGLYGLPHLPPDEAEVVLLPVPWEVTTSYRPGTARGPTAILAASRQVELFDFETGRPYEKGIVLLESSDEVARWNEEGRGLAERVIEAGGRIGPDLSHVLERVNRLSTQLNDWVDREVDRWLGKGKLVGLLGGDHSIPFGALRALCRRHPNMGILHLDAHADLRSAYEGFTFSHASIMYNALAHLPVAKLVQVGVRDLGEEEYERIQNSRGRIVTHFDARLKERSFSGVDWSTQCTEIVSSLPEEVYLSFDIDGLDPGLCPHTGTPVPGGFGFAELNTLLRTVAQSDRRIVGFDLSEVAPGPDGDEWDANVAARVLYKMIGWALLSRGHQATC
jgi:agmatinase